MPSDNVQHRNRWSYEEIKMVITATVELLMLKYKAMDMFPSVDAIQKKDIQIAVKEGQGCLAAPRRKKDFGSILWKKMDKFIRDELRSKIAAHQSNKGKPELAPASAAVLKLATPAPDPVPVEEPQPVVQQVDPITGLGEALGASIARGFVKEIEGSPMMADLIRLLTSRLPKNAIKAVASVSVPGYKQPVEVKGLFNGERIRRPKVAIIGLLPDQRMAIQQKFPNIDLRFLDNRPTGDRLETVTSNCDAAVMMTKFCSHLPMKKCKAKHYVPVNGGMTDLAHVLRGRYGEPTSARHPATAAA